MSMPSFEVARDDFRGVPGRLLRNVRGTTPAQSKPVPRVRPMAAKQTAGFWTPAALGTTGCVLNSRWTSAMTLCGGLRRQASRAKSGVRGGGSPPPSFCRRTTRASRAPQQKAQSRPLEGPQAPKGGNRRTCARAHTLPDWPGV